MPNIPSLTNDETIEDLPQKLVALSRRWTSAGVKGKGITLASHELDLLNAVGLGHVIMLAAADEQKRQAIERRALKDSQ